MHNQDLRRCAVLSRMNTPTGTGKLTYTIARRPRYPHFYPQEANRILEAKRLNSVHNRDGDIFVNNRPRMPTKSTHGATKNNPCPIRRSLQKQRKSAPNAGICEGKAAFPLRAR